MLKGSKIHIIYGLMLAAICCVLTEYINYAYADDISEQQGLQTSRIRTKNQILAYWKGYRTTNKNTIPFCGIKLGNPANCYNNNPKYSSPYGQGTLSPSYLQDSLHVYNTTRYAAGVNPVGLLLKTSDSLTVSVPFSQTRQPIGKYNNATFLEQACSYVQCLNGNISHTPNVPDQLTQNSNIFQAGYRGSSVSNLHHTTASKPAFQVLYTMHFSFIRDCGANNVEVGHRRWQLSPCQNGTAIGAAFYDDIGENYHGYGATLALDETPKNTSNDLIACPGVYNISECFAPDPVGRTPRFSIHFGKNYNFTKATVKITDLSDGNTYTPATNLYMPSSVNYGGLGALVIGNDRNLFTVREGSRLEITIDGVTKNGKPWPIKYTANFFSLKDAEKYNGPVKTIKNPVAKNYSKLSSSQKISTIAKSKLWTVSKSGKSNSIRFQFQSNSPLKLDGYKVYLSKKKTGGFSMIGKITSVGVNINNPWMGGKKIYIKVIGYKKIGKKTAHTKALVDVITK